MLPFGSERPHRAVLRLVGRVSALPPCEGPVPTDPPPEPGRDLTPASLRLTLHNLARAARPPAEDTTAPDEETVPAFPVVDDGFDHDPMARLHFETTMVAVLLPWSS